VTIATLRPQADGTKVGVLYSTGSAIWSLVDDSPDNDSTWIGAANGVQFPYNYWDLVIPDNSLGITGSQRVLRWRIRCRCKLSSADGGRAAKVNIRFLDTRDGWKDTVIASFSSSNTSTFSTLNGPWQTQPSPKSGTYLDQGDINYYRLYGGQYHTGGTIKSNLYLSEIYADFDIRSLGTVTGVVASELTLTTQPLYDWTFNTNTDGDIQKSFQVRVFSTAQYSVAGFNPVTSPATWDSGVMVGNIQEWRHGVGGSGSQTLVQGQTYKIYVRASQDFNGADWWTAYVASSAFTVAIVVQPPPIPTLTVTPDTTVPYLRNFITVQGRNNVLTADNASFETTLGSWTAGTSTTATQYTTGQALHGVYSMSLVRLSTTGDATANLPTGTSGVRVKAGAQYTCVASFKAATTGRSTRVEVTWYDRSGTSISTSTGSNVTDTTSGWTQANITATAPTGAYYASITVRVLAAAANEQHWVDSVSIHIGSSTTWQPGGLIGVASPVVEYSWSTTGRINLIHPQLYGAGDGANLNGDGFYGTPTTGVNAAPPAYDRSDRFNGQGSIRWDVTTSTSKLYIGWPDTGAPSDAPVYGLSAVPGRTYTFSIYAKGSTSFSSQLNLQALDERGNAVGSPTNSGAVTIPTAWTRYSATITVPAGAAFVRPHFDNTANVTNVSLWVDAAQWQLGSVVTPLVAPGGNPVIWTPVRGFDVNDQIFSTDPSDQVLFLEDHEVPPGYTVTYRAWQTYVDTVVDRRISSDYSSYVQTMMNPPGQGVFILTDPLFPLNAMQVTITSIQESQHEESQTFYPLRPVTWQKWGQRGVTVSDFLGGHDGSLTIAVRNDIEWEKVRAFLNTPNTLWLVYPDFGGRYIRITGRSWDRRTWRLGTPDCPVGWLRAVSITYVESDRPGRTVA
jgi:hypothetical protein